MNVLDRSDEHIFLVTGKIKPDFVNVHERELKQTLYISILWHLKKYLPIVMYAYNLNNKWSIIMAKSWKQGYMYFNK